MADQKPAKPFKWLGNSHGKVLWLDVIEDGIPVRKVIGPNQIVKKPENLAALGAERQKFLADKGALVILTALDGILSVDKSSTIDVTDDNLEANAANIEESVATTNQMAKNANVKKLKTDKNQKIELDPEDDETEAPK